MTERSRPSAALPRRLTPLDLLREWRLLGDLAAATRPGWQADLPRGRRPILIIPGFGAGDAATALLRRRLGQLGHPVAGWGLGINRGRLKQDLPRLLPQFDALQALDEQRKVTVVGWSLGGVMARELARARPQGVHEIITLGAPLRGGPKYTFTASWYARQGLDLDEAERKAAAREASRPLPCPLVSVYARHDGMVHYAASLDPLHVSETFEVRCSHLGMCVSPEVLRIIAGRTAE